MKLNNLTQILTLFLVIISLGGCSSIFGSSEEKKEQMQRDQLPALSSKADAPKKSAEGYLLTGYDDTETEPSDASILSSMPDELPPYRLQVGDVLAIKLLLNPELEEEVVIRPDGKISTTVAQNVMAFGKTPEQLQETLNQKYAEYLSDPNVAVIVRSFAPTRIYVLGEVNAPGEYITTGPTFTLLQAIAMAGNIKNSADPDEILVFRRGVGDKPEAYRADYDDATSGLLPGADVRLAAYDVVFVPRTAIADAYVLYEQSIQQFLRPALNLGLSYRLDDKGN